MAFVDSEKSDDMVGNTLNFNLGIDNNDDIEMETDDDDKRSVNNDSNKFVADETEEGELVECNDEGLEEEPVFNEHRPLSRPSVLGERGRPLLKLLEESAFNNINQRFENRSGGFVTGVDIFSAEEQEKLSKRAQRFGIDPSEARTLTQKLLKNLYKCMNVTPGDSHIRLDALHMRGTEEMNTQDVFTYFKDYAPASIEWLSSSSCNVMWLDDISAARALLGLSVKIKNLKPKTQKEENRRKSVDNDSVEDSSMDEEEDSENGSDEEGSDAVSISDISVSVPPGLWRKGVVHTKSKCIFLRFATKDDRRPLQTSKTGEHDISGYVGLISESKKRRLQERTAGIIFYDAGDELCSQSLPEDNNTNPWSAIAYSWGAFDRNKNKIRTESPPKRPTPPPSPVFMGRYDRTMLFHPDMWELKSRRRYKDSHSSDGEEELARKRKVPRMRMHADDEVLIVEKRLRHSLSKRYCERKSDLSHHTGDRGPMIVIKKERSSGSEDKSEEDNENHERGISKGDEEMPDLRVAVVRDRSPSPVDNKEDVWRSGRVKSVLRGARAHDSHSRSHSDERSYDGDSDPRVKSSNKKHESRSRERLSSGRRKEELTSRRHRSRSPGTAMSVTDKNALHHRHCDDYDSDEVQVQRDVEDLRTKISKKKKHSRRRDHAHDREHHRRDHNRDRDHSKVRDRSDKPSSKNKNSYSVFRPRSPLQIEIDNDEYYKLIESD